MSYIIEQKVKDHIYLYKVESYWDKEKKQARQRREYIGKKDINTGKVIEPKHKYSCADYGHVYLLKEIDKQLGLSKILKEIFPDIYEEIIHIAFFKICEGKALYLCNPWLQTIYHEPKLDLSSQTLSRLLKSISERNGEIYFFFKRWISKTQPHNKFIVFDITSISSYAKDIPFIEWGYNRDHESLPQINLGVIYGEPSGYPLFYSIYPGSIHDAKTLRNILAQMDVLSLKKTYFVLDKGFFSTRNLSSMSDLQHIIPFPVRNNGEKDLIRKHFATIASLKNAFRLSKRVYYCVKEKITIKQNEYSAFIYLDEMKRAEAKEQFLKYLLEVEEYIRSVSFSSLEKIEQFLREYKKGFRKYFHIRKRGDKPYLRRNTKEIDETINHMGMFVLLTNTSLSAKDVLEIYRKRDGVEKYFDSFKNSINQKRLRIHSQEALEGLMFTDFISLILHSHILSVLKKTKLNEKYSVPEIIFELKKIRNIIIGEKKSIISEVSKNQTQIYSSFGIKQPGQT